MLNSLDKVTLYFRQGPLDGLSRILPREFLKLDSPISYGYKTGAYLSHFPWRGEFELDLWWDYGTVNHLKGKSYVSSESTSRPGSSDRQ